MRLWLWLGRHVFLLAPLAVLALGVGLRILDPQPLQEVRLRAFDFYQRVLPRAASDLPVKVVEIDEESLRRLGQWPWPRSLLAQLTRRLQAAGPRAIVFTPLFAEADRLSLSAFSARLPDAARLAVESALAAGDVSEPDTLFAEALAATPSVIGFALTAAVTDHAPPKLQIGLSFVGESPLAYLPTLGGWVPALPALEEAASGYGALTLLVDSDGLVRRMGMLFAAEGTVFPALTLEALRVAGKGRGLLVKTSGQEAVAKSGGETGVQAIRAGRTTIQTTPNAALWLYDRPPDPDMRIPAWTLLEGPLPDLRDAIVLVGVTASGLGDRHATALSPSLPGVVLQAHAIEQVWAGVYLLRPAWSDGAEILAVLAVGLLVLLPFAIQRDGALLSGFLGFTVVLAGAGFALWAFRAWQLLFDPVTPALVGLAVFGTAGIARLVVSEQRRRQVRSAFGQYVSPAVVAQIAEDPRAIRLEGATRELTLLFCDIRGFTSLAEHLPPEVLAQLINRFLTQMSQAVLDQRGTIDKYIGDCLMAFWNAPVDVPEHAGAACATVLEMRRRLGALNAMLAEEQEGASPPQLAVGIGLNSGRCSVGNMGSSFRLAYTAMGDAVNLAARLEGMTRIYGLDCLISQSTRQAADDFAFLEIDWIQVKGRSQPATVYALLGDGEVKGSADFALLTEVQAAFLSAYRSQDWPTAEAALARLADLAPSFELTSIVTLFGTRLEQLRREPPGAEWNGVFVATSK